jgi:hypothetical protein
MATKMIRPFLDLLHPEDAAYIQSAEGTWYDDIDKRPIRLKSGETGVSGHKESVDQGGFFVSRLKKIIPKTIKERIKNLIRKS